MLHCIHLISALDCKNREVITPTSVIEVGNVSMYQTMYLNTEYMGGKRGMHVFFRGDHAKTNSDPEVMHHVKEEKPTSLRLIVLAFISCMLHGR